jgi:hypothetical protein
MARQRRCHHCAALSPCYEHTRQGRRFAIGHCWASSPGARFTGATVILMMGCTGWPREGIMLSATDWTGELDALISLARLRGY